MKQYQTLQPTNGIAAGVILSGPLPILGMAILGYYTTENLPSAPSNQCLFASAVENNPGTFKEVSQQKTPTNAGAVTN